MKRYDDLMGSICSMENLVIASHNARIGKKRRKGIVWFDKNATENLLKLQKDLREGTYKTSRYYFFKIKDPKERLIASLPFYPDRICHHAVMRYVEPILIKSLIGQTYSCIKGRGLHKGVKDVKEALLDREGTKYCLKLDIRHFYPSIDQATMKRLIRTKIGDIRVLKVIDEWIDSYDSKEVEGAVGEGTKGLPIGNYPSQQFANFYLSGFDHWMKETKGVKYYFRYADDICVLHHSKEYLHQLRKEMQEYLEKELLLRVKDNWQVYPVEDRGIDFLGYVFRHDYTRLRKRVKKNIVKKVLYCTRKLGLKGKELRKAVGSYQGCLNWGNTRNLTHKINTIANEKVFQ